MSQGCSIDIMSQASEKFSIPSSSDEDDMIVVKRRKKKSKFKSQPDPKDDDSESENDVDQQLIVKSPTSSKKKSRIQIDDSSSDDENLCNLNKNTAINDDDSKITSQENSENSISQNDDGILNSLDKKHSELTESDDESAKNSAKSEHGDNDSAKSSSSENDSDSENSSDDDAPPLRLFRNKNPTVVNESREMISQDDDNEREDNDDGPDPSEIAEPRKSKPKSARRPNMVELHSETQRLVRESAVNLPYHRPEPKKLSEFMKRPTLGKTKDEKKCAQTSEDTAAHIIDELPDIGEETTAKNAIESNNVSPAVADTGDTVICENETQVNQPEVQVRPLTRRERLLQQIGSNLPQLESKTTRKSPGKFIDLDDEATKSKQSTGVDSLLQRFMKHSKAGRNNISDKKRRVEINIVRKQERADGTGVDLVRDVVTTTVGGNDDDKAVKNAETSGTPGQRLQLLRQQLAMKMKKRREIERKKREELHKLDNEEMGQSDAEEEEEEDCDWSEGETDDEVESEEEKEKPIKEEKWGNGVIDSSDESEAEDTEPLDDSSRASVPNNNDLSLPNDSSLPRLVNDGSVLLFEDSTRSSASTLNKSGRMTPMLDRTCSDDSFYGSMIPLHQPEVSNISNSSHFMKRQTSKTGEFDDTCFESDSRSLSQPFRLDFEASQSQFLDADGFIRESSITKPLAKRDRPLLPPGAEDDNAMTDCNMSQLINLCSAPFDSPKTQKKPEISRLMNSGNESAVNDTQDLIGLCTGNFTDSITPLDEDNDSITQNDDDATNKESTKIDCNITNNDENSVDLFKTANVDESFGFNILSGHPIKSQPDPETRFSDEENKSDEDDDQPITIVRKKKFRRGRIAREFVENEAELSGSDQGSGDEDEDEGPNEYEIEEPIEELPEEEEIARQVNRIHRKQVQDEDQRDIELLQEALLGGEEIAERERKFRWKNIESSMTENMFKSDDEDSNHGDANNPLPEGPEDTQWMKQRLEREEFLLKNDVPGAGSEDSQLLSLGRRVVMSRQNSVVLPTADKSSENSKQTARMRTGRLSIDESSSSRDSFKNKGHRGSFLSRSQNVLAKLASLQELKNVNGPRHSDKMLFKTVSPKSKKQTKRKQLSEISNSAVKEPPRKRKKVINVNEDSNSVFDLM